MNLNLSSAVRTAKSVITANSPVLLVGTAIAGVVTTGILAAKGGYKARGIIDVYKIDHAGVEPTPVEHAKLTWQCYIPATAAGGSTIASVFGLHLIHKGRQAAMAGLYAVTTSKLENMQDEVEKMLGPKKAQELSNNMSQRAVEENPPIDYEVVITPAGNELCLEEWTGRWFRGSIPIIEQAVAEVNLSLSEGRDVNVNEFWDYLGLPPRQVGENMGWTPATKVEVQIGGAVAEDNRPAVTFRFPPRSTPTPLSRG